MPAWNWALAGRKLGIQNEIKFGRYLLRGDGTVHTDRQTVGFVLSSYVVMQSSFS